MKNYVSESCPACQAVNWWEVSDNEASSKMDIDAFDCWKCGKHIQILTGDDHTEYLPHVDGTFPGDDQCWGDTAQGREKP